MPSVVPFLPLPGDAQTITAALRAPGGFSAEGEIAPHLARAVAALGLDGLVTIGEAMAPREAAALYRAWLWQHGRGGDSAPAWYNLGVALQRSGKPVEAAAALESAQKLRPGLWQAGLGRGLALEAAGAADAALAAWRELLPPAEARRQIHIQMARLLEDRGRLGEAIEEARAALLIDPHQPDVVQHLVHNRQRTTAWPPAATGVPGLGEDEAAQDAGPLAALALIDDPARQAGICARWINRKVPPAPQRLAPAGGYAHDRLRIGYLSSDFCRHAMSYLIAELLERHDRSRFEIWGYDATRDDGSDVRARVLAALDHHVPIQEMTDEAAAARIRADEIDILIDLNGLTKGARPAILRAKPAPMQVTYLGYIGPVPLPELDYLLCDAVTVPPETEADYSPRPLRIAGCYQANDGVVPELPSVTRAEEGLPEGAMVFTCVSHHYKLTEAVWGRWCRIVARVPGSVLWIIDDNPESRAALTARWAAAGLAPERLIFAARTDPARYRARLALADLFLDTTPYNAGTIASDALRMGLPLITTRGRAFAARMGASLLTAIGLPDCIAEDLAGYEELAVAIGTDPARRAALKAHLAAGAWERTLGDAEDFTRRFEAALIAGRAAM
ncbi:O-linked N-acetylglucosamine transferase, SPINDLY family protein [Rhodobacter capsulatus]|uniref:O-linked N-acetylglucosamine transferase, SPINDLY family protein n=1 Tax=Rhodobacter capsulatus TaxID=1061 RepID=UPI004027C934